MLPNRTAYCWAHVDDIAQGHILAMQKGKPGESYIIAGEPYPVAKAFALASDLTGKRAPMIVPHQMLGLMSILVNPLDALMPPTYTSEGLRVIAGVTYLGDNRKARDELGYNPRPLREGWAETLRHEMKLLGL
jgi:dihydroflavonol-4-reductase